MNSKSFLAIYDEQRLFLEFFHNSLDKFHQYGVLFSASTEKDLFECLTPKVRVLLVHFSVVSERSILIIKKVLKKYPSLNVLVYTQEVELIHQIFHLHLKKVKAVSAFERAREFFNAINEFIPEFSEYEKNTNKRTYNQVGFEKIRNNEKWIDILKCYLDGMKPKEMEDKIHLKPDTINSYTEQMIKQTQCGNLIELILEAKNKSII